MFFSFGMVTSLGEFNQLFSSLKMILCYILLVIEGLGKYINSTYHV